MHLPHFLHIFNSGLNNAGNKLAQHVPHMYYVYHIQEFMVLQ